MGMTGGVGVGGGGRGWGGKSNIATEQSGWTQKHELVDVDHFHIALFSALEQTRCVLVA